mmetsp:Transcript_32301/g.46892  ORF Transcript_32301/g.46892 Transcript_32301/m.46892 type:complete len:96 (-) Transcript_32301:352-639(-)
MQNFSTSEARTEKSHIRRRLVITNLLIWYFFPTKSIDPDQASWLYVFLERYIPVFFPKECDQQCQNPHDVPQEESGKSQPPKLAPPHKFDMTKTC